MNLPLRVDDRAPPSPGSLTGVEAAGQVVQLVSDRVIGLGASKQGVELAGYLPGGKDPVDLQADGVVDLDRSPGVAGLGSHGGEDVMVTVVMN